MLITTYECTKCKFKMEVKTNIEMSPFMIIINGLKVTIVKNIMKIHCKIKKHYYKAWEEFDED